MLEIKSVEVIDTRNGSNTEDLHVTNMTIIKSGGASTREYNIVVDHLDKDNVFGDVIAFGSWYDVEEEEIKEVLAQAYSQTNIEDLLQSASSPFKIKSYLQV